MHKGKVIPASPNFIQKMEDLSKVCDELNLLRKSLDAQTAILVAGQVECWRKIAREEMGIPKDGNWVFHYNSDLQVVVCKGTEEEYKSEELRDALIQKLKSLGAPQGLIDDALRVADEVIADKLGIQSPSEKMRGVKNTVQ